MSKIRKIINKILRKKNIKKIIEKLNNYEIKNEEKIIKKKMCQYENYSLFERIFQEVENEKIFFSGWALAKSSIIALIPFLQNSNYNIFEFGGGTSTIFFNKLINNNYKIKVYTYEHNKEWFILLKDNKNINSKSCILFHTELKQISDEDKKQLFKNPQEAEKIWKEKSKLVKKEDHINTSIKNVFYDIDYTQYNDLKFIDIIILDGPHGNGRSLAFPLLYKFINKNTIILIDDYKHYPFLSDLFKIFKYEIVIKKHYLISGKQWCIVKITGKK